jgi:D-alanyl-D-alanine carboxypeptidase
MSFVKIITSILIVVFSVATFSFKPVWADAPQPPITGEYGIAIDAVTGQVLYDKDGDAQAYPASMTKILTAIVTDERVKDNQIFTVSANAAGQECSCFGLKAGEQISKKDALYGLLLLSANDMAVAIAENVAGSVPAFAQLMNDEVQKLGLQHTHFVTPNGLHDPNHYTTPHDMALIMKEALKHPEVLKVLSTQSIHVHTSLQDKTIRNTSKVHTQPPSAHVIAGKTGFTDQAGNTLVEYLKEGNKEVIAVVMKTNKQAQYNDIQTMANYAFAQMKTELIASKGEVVDKAELNGKKVDLIAPNDIAVSVKSDDTPSLDTEIDLVAVSKKDIKKGQVVANLKVLSDGNLLKEVPLVTDQAIKKPVSGKAVQKKSKGFTAADSIPVEISLGLVILVGLSMFINVQNRKKAIRK